MYCFLLPSHNECLVTGQRSVLSTYDFLLQEIQAHISYWWCSAVLYKAGTNCMAVTCLLEAFKVEVGFCLSNLTGFAKGLIKESYHWVGG